MKNRCGSEVDRSVNPQIHVGSSAGCFGKINVRKIVMNVMRKLIFIDIKPRTDLSGG